MEQRNKFSVGDEVELMKPSGENVTVTVQAMQDEYGEAIESCPHSKQIFKVLFSKVPEKMDLIRVASQE